MKKTEAFKINRRAARQTWGILSQSSAEALRHLTIRFDLSVPLGDLQLLDGRWYVTHSGLLRIAVMRGCCGIRTSVQKGFSKPEANQWVFRATVYASQRSKGFVGYGDANPANVSPRVRGAEMRVAETRAVNRALRKAYGIGLCSVEELKYSHGVTESPDWESRSHVVPLTNKDGNGQPRLRDRLSLLIRQHRLDLGAVKLYAASFCETTHLRDANREQIEAFINHLDEWAARDREGLLCKLNSLVPHQEVQS